MAGGRLSRAKDTADSGRLFPRLDRLFVLFIALELLTFPLLPLAPLAVAGIATATSVRRSRPHVLALWILGAILAVIVVAPFVIGLFGAQFIEEGPVHHAG